ncbi:MAG: recombination protein RecR [Candidatus Latescibacterota bacterium]|jgi:recombination protein RecR
MGPAPLEDLIMAFAKLPGIGRVTAQRLALYVVKRPRDEAEQLAHALVGVKDGIKKCSECFNFTELSSELCAVCRDDRRDRLCICVVEEASDVLALEANQIHRGVFHVLGGVLSPLEGISPDDLRITELVERVQREQTREVILALNAGPEGDATANYLHQLLSAQTRVSRPARGLPVGADLDLADRVTLTHAFAGRSPL